MEVEAGMTLGDLAVWLREAQAGEPRPWILPLGFDAFAAPKARAAMFRPACTRTSAIFTIRKDNRTWPPSSF